LLTWGYRTLVQVELAAGELAAAHQALQGDEHMANPVKNGVYHSWAVGIRVQWWLAMGKLEAASEWAAHVVFRQDDWEPQRAEEFLALIRVYLARAEYALAVEALERFSEHLDRPGDMTITIEFLSLYVVALQQAGRSTQARSVAARLLSLTEAEGHIRVYLDAGEAMKHVLQSFLDASQSPAAPRSSIATVLAAFKQQERKHATRGGVPPPASSREQEAQARISPRLPDPASSAVVHMEALTPQEDRVLQLLAQGASNQQIAIQLVIELSTVKKHVTHLLAKLGALNRTQAVVRAREYGLL
jgi:LuxR family maltose regulon positive regulatory protein